MNKTIYEIVNQYADDLSLSDRFEIRLGDGDAWLLQEYVAKINPPNCYVEIGTLHGGSALVARDAAKPEVEVYTVDWEDIYKLKHRQDIHFIHAPSLDAAIDWKKPIGVLFIDGHHELAGVDFGAWDKYVVKGGYILFHDYASHSPKVISDCRAIVTCTSERYKIIYEPSEGKPTSIFVIQKV